MVVLLTIVGAYTLVEKPIVFNLSPSVPVGLYTKCDGAPHIGQLIEFRSPVSLAEKSRDRWILKPILAAAGDHVDTTGDWLRVNGRAIALIQTKDSDAKPLPIWRANRSLEQDEYFVFSARVPNSFDSRYFGPIRTSDIVAVRTPLWTWGKHGETEVDGHWLRRPSNDQE